MRACETMRRCAPMCRRPNLPLAADARTALGPSGTREGKRRGPWLAWPPSVKAQVSLTSLEVLDKPAGELAASAQWDGQKLMAKLSGDQPAGGSLRTQAELPFTPAAWEPVR